jgi:septum formation protein
VGKRTILLASASPRRRDLLREHGYEVRVRPSHAEEVTPDFLTVGETTLLNAKIKAAEISRTEPDALVLAADTLVAFEGKIFGKPRDLGEAFAMLEQLNGRIHEVFSGVWLAHMARKKQRGFIVASRVSFRKMGVSEISEYIARVNPLDKAGAYAAQQNEMNLIASIEGSYTNVVGLPMEALDAELDGFFN